MVSWSHCETMRYQIVSWLTFIFLPTTLWDYLMASQWHTKISHCRIVSMWDNEISLGLMVISHGLTVNFSIFTHPTIRHSHGLMVKLPLNILFFAHKILQTINMQPGKNMMVSWSHCETMRYLIVSWWTFIYLPTPLWDNLMASQ